MNIKSHCRIRAIKTEQDCPDEAECYLDSKDSFSDILDNQNSRVNKKQDLNNDSLSLNESDKNEKIHSNQKKTPYIMKTAPNTHPKSSVLCYPRKLDLLSKEHNQGTKKKQKIELQEENSIKLNEKSKLGTQPTESSKLFKKGAELKRILIGSPNHKKSSFVFGANQEGKIISRFRSPRASTQKVCLMLHNRKSSVKTNRNNSTNGKCIEEKMLQDFLQKKDIITAKYKKMYEKIHEEESAEMECSIMDQTRKFESINSEDMKTCINNIKIKYEEITQLIQKQQIIEQEEVLHYYKSSLGQ